MLPTETYRVLTAKIRKGPHRLNPAHGMSTTAPPKPDAIPLPP